MKQPKITDLREIKLENTLTQQEVDNLPTGTPITVLWSGGNGPFDYKIVNVNGLAYTAMLGCFLPSDARLLPDNRLDFVGPAPLTQVSIKLQI